MAHHGPRCEQEDVYIHADLAPNSPHAVASRPEACLSRPVNLECCQRRKCSFPARDTCPKPQYSMCVLPPLPACCPDCPPGPPQHCAELPLPPPVARPHLVPVCAAPKAVLAEQRASRVEDAAVPRRNRRAHVQVRPRRGIVWLLGHWCCPHGPSLCEQAWVGQLVPSGTAVLFMPMLGVSSPMLHPRSALNSPSQCVFAAELGVTSDAFLVPHLGVDALDMAIQVRLALKLLSAI